MKSKFHTIAAVAAVGLFAFGSALYAAKPVPRPADPLTITEPTGKQISLASLKGKVVVIQFLYTWCEHCQRTAQTLSNLQTELGPKGLQVIGLAFNDEVNTPDTTKNRAEAASFATRFAKFPVGLTSKQNVLGYLGMSVMERYAVPQIMVIDRKGVVQAQTAPMPDGKLQDEAYMRTFLGKLLNEPAVISSTKK